MTRQLAVVGGVTDKIFFARGVRVMLGQDLAALYEVAPKALLQAVKRNRARFPPDFCFQLTRPEREVLLRSQTVTLENGKPHPGRGRHPKYLPWAFTEHGVAMLASVLRSERAAKVNVEIIRAFVRLRDLASNHADLAEKIRALEKKYDAQFKVICRAIDELSDPPGKPGKPIGFAISRSA